MAEVTNKIKTNLEKSPNGKELLVVEDVDGVKAVPMVLVTIDENGKYSYAGSLGGGGGLTAEQVNQMLAGYSKTDHNHDSVYAKTSTLSNYATTTQLNTKLTANKMTNIPNSAATDVAGVVADLNKVLAGLKAAGIMS